jgi:hypothetical protein
MLAYFFRNVFSVGEPSAIVKENLGNSRGNTHLRVPPCFSSSVVGAMLSSPQHHPQRSHQLCLGQRI